MPPDEKDVVEIDVRVRYPECDPAGVAHHSVYPVWLELARGEMLREQGAAYRELVEQGVMFVVARMSFRFRKPVYYDEVIQVRAWITSRGASKVDYAYELKRDQDVVATAETTLVCVDRQGRINRIPPQIM